MIYLLDTDTLIYLIKHRPPAVAARVDALTRQVPVFFDATLVSNNTREFGRIARLRLENWV